MGDAEAGGAEQPLEEELEDGGEEDEGGSVEGAWEDGGWAGGLDVVFCRLSSPTDPGGDS